MKQKRLIIRSIISVLIGLVANSALAKTSAPQSSKIQLVVVAVPEFTTQEYNIKGFKDAITERCEELRKFFENHVGKENLDEHLLCTKADTTAASIKRLFQTDFTGIASRTLTFVFIISHGEPVQYRNSALPSDLRILTSNFDPNNPDLTSLAVTAELLKWFEKISAGSTVITFIDTCYAGSAVSPAAAMSAATQQIFGHTRLFVMGSSLRLEESYGAAFTKALLTLWDKQEGCVDPQTIKLAIKDQINHTIPKPLGEFEGIAKVIVGYAGPLCFGNFGSDGRLLFLYQGTDQGDMIWKVFAGPGSQPKQLKWGEFPDRFFDMVRMDAGLYKVEFLTKGQPLAPFTDVDLKAHSFQAVFAEPPKIAGRLQRFVQNMVEATAANGSPDSDTALLKQVSHSLTEAVTLGHEDDADSVVRSIEISGAAFENLPKVQAAAFKSQSEAQGLWQSSGLTPEEAGVGLFLLGDFVNAAEAFWVKACTSADEATRRKFQELALHTFNIAGSHRETVGTADRQTQAETQTDLRAPFDFRDSIDPANVKIGGAGSQSNGSVLNGRVTYDGTPEKLKPIDMSAEPNCAKYYSAPPMPEISLTGSDNSLQNVIVYLSAGAPDENFTGPVVHLNQLGCRYTPHIIAVQTNQEVSVQNYDTVTHSVHPMARSNVERNRWLPSGTPPVVIRYSQPEFISVRCEFHPWMRGVLAIFKNSHHAVSDGTGAYTLPNLPPGKYTVTAWHEVYGSVSKEITIEPRQNAELNFVFKVTPY